MDNIHWIYTTLVPRPRKVTYWQCFERCVYQLFRKKGAQFFSKSAIMRIEHVNEKVEIGVKCANAGGGESVKGD